MVLLCYSRKTNRKRDRTPVGKGLVYSAFVKENSPVDTPVMELLAEDKDSPKNSVIRYAIVGGSGKHAFTVDSATGMIKTKKLFDYEERLDYSLEVLASNPDSSLYGTAKVDVSIEGVNEYYPKFVQPVFHFTISESAPIGSQIGSVQAIDDDGGDDGLVFYLFVGSSNDRGFFINPTSGAITVAKKLDRESQSRVVLTVLAKNRGPIRGNDTDEAQVIITVQDGNDPPVFEKENYQVSVSEGAVVGTRVGTVKATDIDVRPSNNRFSYKILDGNTNSSFKLDPMTGIISTMIPLDREETETFTLIVGAIDMGQPPQTGTTIVNIKVEDVNDNGPVLEKTSMEGTILENEPPYSRVMTLRATDADLSPNGAPFSYNLVGGVDASKFKVDSKSGLVTSMVSFDREVTPELKITIEISDNGIPAQRTRQDVKIVVLDKNDSPSQGRNAQVIVYTYKDITPVHKIASVEPIDPDTTGHYTCRLENGQDNFKIFSNCDLHVSRIPSQKRQSLKVLSDDGIHAEVASSMRVEFLSFDNDTLENSLIVRVLDLKADKFMERFYSKFITFCTQIFRQDVKVYSLLDHENGTDVVIASRSSGGQYLLPEHMKNSLKQHKGRLESLLGVKTIIDYSICDSHDICQNGGTCSHTLRTFAMQRVSSSPLFILSSPSVQVEFMCKCLAGFTGKCLFFCLRNYVLDMY